MIVCQKLGEMTTIPGGKKSVVNIKNSHSEKENSKTKK